MDFHPCLSSVYPRRLFLEPPFPGKGSVHHAEHHQNTTDGRKPSSADQETLHLDASVTTVVVAGKLRRAWRGGAAKENQKAKGKWQKAKV
ncbi:MAG: hypothetical protein ABSA59_07460 [Terriglobia bacterium]